MRRVTIFDTTLRDGDQAAGFSFGGKDKLALAFALAEAGVDVIKIGKPPALPGDSKGLTFTGVLKVFKFTQRWTL
ncbi:MAG: hypothetical protein LBU16_03520 [Treponema sp.]|nr:hypothetical protein [Treponema sp.]